MSDSVKVQFEVESWLADDEASTPYETRRDRRFTPWDDALADTARMNRWIEERIRENPAQYLWVHKRFKTRPAGEPGLY